MFPDTRFGTTFLDMINENAAVKHEVLMNKVTGEMFLKRPTDGKMISFTQNDKYVYDSLLELRILMNSDSPFNYPKTNTSFFTSIDYATRYLRNDNKYDVLSGSSMQFSQSSSSDERFEFYTSPEASGFYLLLKPRTTDKVVIEYLTNLYDSVCKEYTGNDPELIVQRNKYVTIPNWENVNATVVYTLEVTGISKSTNQERIIELDRTSYVRIGQHSLIRIGNELNEYFNRVLKIKVTVTNILFSKITFAQKDILNRQGYTKDTFNSLLAPDKRIDIPVSNVLSFIDNTRDIINGSSRTIIMGYDTHNLGRYLDIVDKINVSKGTISSPMRPSDGEWSVHNSWHEVIRYVNKSDNITTVDHETDIDSLIDYLYKVNGIETGFTLNPDDEMMLLIDID